MYITGDTHGNHSISKLNTDNFPQNNFLTKDNYVIVAGDFGLVWDKSKEQAYWQKWLHEKNFTTLFVDGNHENFDLLDSYPVKEWNGGKVHFINDSIIHLMRGQVYTINGKKIFTFGGAESIDKAYRLPTISWWEREMPLTKEYEEGLENLEKHNWEVDYIITHECSNIMFDKLLEAKFFTTKYDTSVPLRKYFDVLENTVKFKHWYFGHYHIDMQLDDKHTVIYDRVSLI